MLQKIPEAVKCILAMRTIVYGHSGYLLPAYTYYRVLRNHGPHRSGQAKLMGCLGLRGRAASKLVTLSRTSIYHEPAGRVKVPQNWRHSLHECNIVDLEVKPQLSKFI